MSTRASTLLDLPAEILDLIILIIHQDGNESAHCLKSLSCVCTSIRQLTMPLLFGKRTTCSSVGSSSGRVSGRHSGYLGWQMDIDLRLAQYVILHQIVDRFSFLDADGPRRTYDFSSVVRAMGKMSKLRTVRLVMYRAVCRPGLLRSLHSPLSALQARYR